MTLYNDLWSVPEVIDAGRPGAPGVVISARALSLPLNGVHIELAEGDTRHTAVVAQHLSASVTVPADDTLIGFHVVVTGGVNLLAGGRATVIVQVAGNVHVLEFPGVFDLERPGDGSTPQYERSFRLEFLAMERRAAAPEAARRPIPACLVSMTLTAQRATLAESVSIYVDALDLIALIERPENI